MAEVYWLRLLVVGTVMIWAAFHSVEMLIWDWYLHLTLSDVLSTSTEMIMPFFPFFSVNGVNYMN